MKPMKPEFIILHHSLTADSYTVSWGAIRKYHTLQLGWRDIGYHFGIENINGQIEILMGRMPDEFGAHCKQEGMNRKSVGICFVGNFDKEPPPEAVWEAGLKLVAYFCKRHGIPVENVKAHRDYANYKSCPGDMFDMELFRTHLLKYLPEERIHSHSIEGAPV